MKKEFFISKLSENCRSCRNYLAMLEEEFMHKLSIGQIAFDGNKCVKALRTRRLSICEKSDHDSSHSDAGGELKFI